MAGRLVYPYDHNAPILGGQPSAPGSYIYYYHAGLVLEISVSVRGNSIPVIQFGGCV